ncbi:MAG: LysR family transcriptional regulator [Methanobrevibacter ruminantium]|uniref:LysR family transcriptional regulator n=1 Tax=Methanobrevibacter ruminantium TaxID=83816 RepID=UPI0026EA3F09|nr:LysR family transcriptional regulator [Methanobrevibacter ruminantium]MDD6049018.1 LysR family transcriptional regulator [Methanobrevibacter ruminantium]MDO5842453.1 LysR family transcriptional regulator [Methanobrevibacter ruminantium]
MANHENQNQEEVFTNDNNSIKPEIGIEIDGISFNYKFFETLESLSKTYSQRKTAKELKVSHSVLNRRIKNAEDKLGEKLVITVGSGSELSEKGYELLDLYYKYKNRLEDRQEIIIVGGHIITGLLQAISYDLPFKTLIYSSDDESAYELAKQDLVDILALDDPLLAFENDLNFTAIAYDHLVLISPNHGKTIERISDLEGLKFIGVKGSAQRLAWSTLRQENINFTIEREVKSQFDAFKIVRNSDEYYTFLNASYFNGNEILKNETRHVISLVQINDTKDDIYNLIEYLLFDGQTKIGEQGFIPMKPWKTR